MATQPPPLPPMHEGTRIEYQARTKNGNTILSSFDSYDKIEEFAIERAGKGVFFRCFLVETKITEFEL